MVLICISQMISDIERIFGICWPSACLLWKNIYLALLSSLNWIVCFVWPLSCMSSIYILEINSLSDTWFANIFSHLVGFLLILLMVLLPWSFLITGYWPFKMMWGALYIKKKQVICDRSTIFLFMVCLSLDLVDNAEIFTPLLPYSLHIN